MNGLDFGTAIGLIKGLGSPDPAVIESAVSDWLDDHPEATTTVQDGSITKAKLDSNLQGTVDDVADLKSQKADVGLALGAYPTDTVSGAVASFSDGADGIPVKDLTIGIEPVQSGSGDPSPDNVRPISGWTGANINANGTTIPITFPTEAGTVYGGTLDVTTGVLTVDKAIADLGSLVWTYNSAYEYFRSTTLVNTYGALNNPSNRLLCPIYRQGTLSNIGNTAFDLIMVVGFHSTQRALNIRDKRFTDVEEFKTAVTGIPIVFDLTNPQTYQLTPIEVLTLLGANTIYADTGNTTVTYRADPTLYADKRSNATRSIIAGIEPTMTASKAYTAGQLLIVGDMLYKVAASIASGATLTPGTNVNPTTVAEQLLLLANA